MLAHSFYRLPGGEDRYVRRQAALMEGAHEVDLFEARNEDLSPSPATAGRMIFSRRMRDQVEARIESFRPGVVHLHNAYPSLGPAVHLAASRRHVPLVMTVHNLRMRCPNGYMFTEGSLCRRCEGGGYQNALLHRCFPSRSQAAAYATALWIHRFPMNIHRSVRTFIAPSRSMRDRLAGWGFPSERVALIRHFVEVAPQATPEPGEYGLYMGRLSGEKGLPVLLQALKGAGDPPFRFAGDGPLREILAAQIGKLGLANTELLGWVGPEDLAPLLAGARYVAMPSVCEENAPLAAMEALASGRPLLASSLGGLPELAEGGRGILCAPGDAAGLAGGISAFMGDPALCRRAGSLGIDFAGTHLSAEAHLQGLDRVYDAALS